MGIKETSSSIASWGNLCFRGNSLYVVDSIKESGASKVNLCLTFHLTYENEVQIIERDVAEINIDSHKGTFEEDMSIGYHFKYDDQDRLILAEYLNGKSIHYKFEGDRMSWAKWQDGSESFYDEIGLLKCVSPEGKVAYLRTKRDE